MKQALPIISILILLILISGIGWAIYSTASKDTSVHISPSPTPLPISLEYEYPIENRTFLMGTAGFVPKNYPNFTNSDISDFWELTSSAGELHGIYVDWKETDIVDPSIIGTDNDIVLELGLQDSKEWNTETADKLIATANEFLVNYPNEIKYLGIGNEVNLLYEDNPQEFGQFVDTYKYIYQEIKSDYPNLYVYTIFHYEALRGEGYISGKADIRDPQWDMIAMFAGYNDMIAITTYPYMDYTSPNEIPDDYLTDITDYSDKPIAIVETGWMARQEFGPDLEYLTEQGYTGSEQEQVEYFMRLLDLTKGNDIEFINWSWIHDIEAWENGTNSEQGNWAIFDSTALRYNNGNPKEIWYVWIDFLQLRPE